MKLNTQIIIHIMGLLLLCNGSFMLLAALASGIYKDGVTMDIMLAAIVTMLFGIMAMFYTRGHKKEVKRKEGYIVVTFGWIIMSISGTLPYLFSGAIPSITDAFFETMSGYTTTGASILDDIEALPEGILLWRSLTHWIGGMGIIVLAIAILPLLGIGGMQLFAAEAPGPGGDKLHPRITDTAKRLWLIYFGYTVLESLLLKFAGMSFFDAINHALATMSTGGFSTKNASLAYWNDQPLIQYIVILFMFLAGSNFVLSYFALTGRGQRILRDEEFKYYFGFIVIFTLIVALGVYFKADVPVSDFHPMIFGEAESAFRHSLFQVIAVITTTGFVSADFTSWTPFLTVFFFGLMFLGGSAGSTAGGIKVMRHLLIIKNGILEFKRTLHPNAVIPVRYNQKTVTEHIVYNVIAFFVLYMLLFIIGSLVLGFLGLDFVSAVGGSASSLGNVGPALGSLNPVSNYNSLPAAGKWWCGFLMLLGRLELFTVLIVLTPYFWKKT
ncbi:MULTISPECIES: TrkH family potassium uptake protein [unclassified Allomuricauda]|jgi:trk system potassium uptake protein TrkH|uniref:TrkH family potassium uptake protein n=1 Tax=Flavobacteriaceae TaxID=49546 RepID=UPI001B20F550|nr:MULTISPECIES: potassium transporter TrkG [unclassified Allomuricauda]MBO6531552.1 TrkH family potassium uptake protein [Allomuricauda sp.]MBO6589467.1 TrkH family potassium uptake protein [Allomuricauda sp.]MBO6619101.1 TrkH family potassium uptake protein [Allomuricauda sp.]MBO6645003.1 TrkH family potassium uptake protein [Allomuricauda sp.]MBO6747222.1 TrkH family potassium uptake protein [Allomuricauda sp.]